MNESETKTGQESGNVSRDLPAEEVNRQVRDIDRLDAKGKTNWTPDQLWAQWKSYVARQEAHDPPAVALVSEFALVIGLSFPDLHTYTERGGAWAKTTKRIMLDCLQRIEQRLVRGQGTIGAIFWLKNRANWRDKSEAEVSADHEDWLTKMQANQGSVQDRTASPDRVSAPPQPGEDAQPLTLEEDSTDSDTPPRLVMSA